MAQLEPAETCGSASTIAPSILRVLDAQYALAETSRHSTQVSALITAINVGDLRMCHEFMTASPDRNSVLLAVFRIVHKNDSNVNHIVALCMQLSNEQQVSVSLKGSSSIRVIVVLLDGWNGDWADVA
jgi:hypothetical protein